MRSGAVSTGLKRRRTRGVIRLSCFIMEEVIEELEAIIQPEPDEDGHISIEFPPADLKFVHGLDAESYIRDSTFYEGSTLHGHTRVRRDNPVLALLGKSNGVPYDLFASGLRIFANSLTEYDGKQQREGEFHYYPPAILTFWAGFECFVRYASTMMVETVRNVPEAVADVLLERQRYYAVLIRFETLLLHGYGYRANRGNRWWQRLDQARELRDHFTHIRVDTPRGISSDEVLGFMEDVLIGLIRPSCDLSRSVMLGQYRLYEAVRHLMDANETFIEKPFFLEWNMNRGLHGFHCNFENVDDDRFPVGTDYDRIRMLPDA